MENVINKACLCQLEQAICCLPKPLSEQRKQIFLVERGAESPTGADWSCVLSSTVPLHLPLLESVGKRSHPRRRDTFPCGRQENSRYLPVTVTQPKDETRMGQIRHMHASKCLVRILASTSFPAFPTCWLSLIQCHVPGKPRL
ncbi:hypothetical protein QQF64_007041 [Cirrhinus molitorella]|uniref:Uncharacterized protein n=1 Tax=Cirrhinus molitorella TaxID=172907 RepID=A0ABR3MBW3_9TELE